MRELSGLETAYLLAATDGTRLTPRLAEPEVQSLIEQGLLDAAGAPTASGRLVAEDALQAARRAAVWYASR